MSDKVDQGSWAHQENVNWFEKWIWDIEPPEGINIRMCEANGMEGTVKNAYVMISYQDQTKPGSSRYATPISCLQSTLLFQKMVQNTYNKYIQKYTKNTEIS
ncbi:MAG: hypothetical protein KGI54_09610 [Pseudomonadota bacterium]|nr:hypothetical protein [Pseudomonadota bacterium]